jgi:hypothetical protein
MLMSYCMLVVQGDVACADATVGALQKASRERLQVKWAKGSIGHVERANKRNDGEIPKLNFPHSRIGTFERPCSAAPDTPILLLLDPLEQEAAEVVVKGCALDYLIKNRLDAYPSPTSLPSVSARAASAGSLIDEKSRPQVVPNWIGDAIAVAEPSGRVSCSIKSEVLRQRPCPQTQGRHLSRLAPAEKPGRPLDCGTADAAYA